MDVDSPTAVSTSFSNLGDSAPFTRLPAGAGRTTSCPLCGHATRPQFVKQGINIVECCQCLHRFADFPVSDQHVARYYGDDYFAGGGGAGYADYTRDARILQARGRSYANRIHKYVSKGRVLDVGAAAGFVLQGFADHGWQTAGVEPNRRMAEFANQTYAVNVAQGTLETFGTTDRFDLVLLLQVLAHFHDVHAAIARVAQLCRPGGHCLIETWDRGSWIARLMGRYWHEYSPPTVLHFFTASAVDRLLETHGFRRVARGRPGKWISGSHAKSLFQHHLGPSSFGKLLCAPTRLIPDRLPLPYPAVDLFWALYQKQQVE